MTFRSLYERCIQDWPDEIDISDGEPKGDTGYYFLKLSMLWDTIEQRHQSNDDRWADLMTWCLFGCFHTEAMSLIKAGSGVLLTREVSLEAIDANLRSNLAKHPDGDDPWVVERAQYDGL